MNYSKLATCHLPACLLPIRSYLLPLSCSLGAIYAALLVGMLLHAAGRHPCCYHHLISPSAVVAAAAKLTTFVVVEAERCASMSGGLGPPKNPLANCESQITIPWAERHTVVS